MPVYQYQCDSCNHKFDLRQSFNDESIASCPKCNNGARRLFRPVPIIFKGSGFYVTDNARKSEAQDSPKTASDVNKDTSKAEKPDNAKSEKKEDTKVENKAEKAA